MEIRILSLKSEKSMRAVVTGGIGGVVDTFGKSLKYATCFGEFTNLEEIIQRGIAGPWTTVTEVFPSISWPKTIVDTDNVVCDVLSGI